MTRNPRSTRPGALFWAGVTLVALWNAVLIMAALASAHEYTRCVADDGFICFDFSGPILVVMVAVDEVAALTVWFVRRHRAGGLIRRSDAARADGGMAPSPRAPTRTRRTRE